MSQELLQILALNDVCSLPMSYLNISTLNLKISLRNLEILPVYASEVFQSIEQRKSH